MDNKNTFMLVTGQEKAWKIGKYVEDGKCFVGERIRKSGKIETFVVPVENVVYILSVEK